MNEKEFLDILREQLEESGVDEIYVEKYVTQFKRYFDNISDDDISEQINSLGDMNDIVENLVNLIEAKKHSNVSHEVFSESNVPSNDNIKMREKTNEENETNHSDAYNEHLNEQDDEPLKKSSDSGDAQNTENRDFVQSDKDDVVHETDFCDKGNDEPATEDRNDEISVKNEAEENEHSDNDYGFLSDNDSNAEQIVPSVKDKNAEDYYDDYIFEGVQFPVYEEKPRGFLKNIFGNRKGNIDADYDYYDDADEYEEYEAYRRRIEDERFFGRWEPLESEISKKYFWGIGLGTLPITILLFLAMSGVFLFGFGVLSLAIVALIAFLVVITAVGAAIAISGIIFGIVKCFSVFPIGLYEIGIAIKYCGVALALGILVYNTAVRLMPLAIRYLINLYFVVLRYVKKGIYIFRQRCANLK